MDKWEASFICVLSQVEAMAVIIVSVSPPYSQCLAKLRPRVSFYTEGDNNTPNPPLTALLTQSIPCGVRRCQVARCQVVVVVETATQRFFAVMSARCGSGSLGLFLTRPTLVGDNEQDSAVMTMTLFVCKGEVSDGRLPIRLEWVSGWMGVVKDSFPLSGLWLYVCV